MCSHRDDVTIVGGWGGYERGWTEQVEKRYEWAAARFGGAAKFTLKIFPWSSPGKFVAGHIERSHVRLSGKEGVVPMALRVTTIYSL